MPSAASLPNATRVESVVAQVVITDVSAVGGVYAAYGIESPLARACVAVLVMVVLGRGYTTLVGEP